jgi:hypothetical protein
VIYTPYYDDGRLQGVMLALGAGRAKSVPKNPLNRDWRAFQAWYAEQRPVPFPLTDRAPDPPSPPSAAEAAILKADPVEWARLTTRQQADLDAIIAAEAKRIGDRIRG